MNTKIAYSLVLSLLFVGHISAADPVRDSGVDGGVLVRVGCDEPAALMAMKAENCIVQGLDTDAKNVAAARQAIDRRAPLGDRRR